MSTNKKTKIIVFGNGHYASSVIETILGLPNYEIIGLCSNKINSNLKTRCKNYFSNLLGRLGCRLTDGFIYVDPFRINDPVKIANYNNIKIIMAAQLNTNGFLEEIQRLKPDIIIVAGFNRIIKKEIFQLSKLISINLHPSLLPKYRGGTPTRWLIYDGEKETGITAHIMTEELDAGDIICTKSFEIDEENDTWGDVENKILKQIPGFIVTVLDKIVDGKFTPVKQNQEEVTYQVPLHGKLQYINWNNNAKKTERFIRALKPKSGGLALINNVKVCVWKINLVKENLSVYTPGLVEDIKDNGNILVHCGNSTGEIIEILHFGKIYNAKKLCQIAKINIGDSFQIVESRC